MPPRSTRTPSAVARTSKASASSSSDGSPVPIDDVEGAAGQVVDVPRDEEAFERRLADARALSGREVIDPGDVAVVPEAAQLAFEAIDEGEGRLRGLRGVARVGVRGVDLEHGVHGLVRETPQTRARGCPRARSRRRVRERLAWSMLDMPTLDAGTRGDMPG